MVRTEAFRSFSKFIGVSFIFSSLRGALATKQSTFPRASWIASRSLSSGAHSRDLLARNDESPSIVSRHAEPERILHDPQADLAAERHQRFRVKLHAADRQGLVLDRHRDAVLGARGDTEHLRHAVALDIE